MKSILEEVTVGTIERADTHNLVVAKADEEIHKQVQETAIQARATQAYVNLHVTDWVTVQQEDPILKIAIKWISNQNAQDQKHLLGDNANTEEGKTILWEWKKLTLYHCHTPTHEVEDILQFVVPTAHWVAAMTHSGGQEWPHRCRRWSVNVSNASSMKPVMPKPQCDLYLLLHLWSCCTLTLPVLRQLWSWINPQMWWQFWSFETTLQNTSWHMWPPIKLQRLFLRFCGKDISQSLEHWPSSWVTEEPTLKATSSESFAHLWAFGRLGLNLTMLIPMDRWNEHTKHQCTLYWN